jgi:PilZ domain
MHPARMEATQAEPHAKERRHEPRERCEFPIEVSGFDVEGEFFTEETTTVDVSPCGCSFLLRTPVESKSVVAIRSLRAAKPNTPVHTVLFQIAHIEPGTAGSVVGASRLYTGANGSSDISGDVKG